MGESDRQRDRRDREFQRRILAALEKQPRGHFVTIINSSLFLWFLSAVVLTTGGAYITKRQDCVHQGGQVVEQNDKLKQELHSRKASAWKIVGRAKSMDELIERLPSCAGYYAEYKDRSTRELEQMSYRLAYRVNKEEDHPRSDLAEVVTNGFKSEDAVPPTDDELWDFSMIERCFVTDTLRATTLARAQMYVKYATLSKDAARSVDQMFAAYVPSCTFFDVWRLMLFEEQAGIRQLQTDY